MQKNPSMLSSMPLNVYSPDGFFKAHRDTPASTDMFGSLVICLPTEFSGGQLIIRSPDLSTCVTHDWGSTSSDRSSSSGCRLAWAAMCSNCEHEITPITTGHRVTLTYNLYTPANSNHNSSSHDSGAATAAQESAFGAQLSSALSDATWYPEGVTLGLVLEHSYAAESLQECLAGCPDSPDYSPSCLFYNHSLRYYDNMPDSIEPGSLKGSDLQLYRAAHALGLEVKIVPVVSLDKPCGKASTGFWDSEEDKEECAVSECASPLSPDMLVPISSFKAKPTGGNGWNEEDDSWAAFLQAQIAQNCPARITGDLLWVKQPGKQHLQYCGPVREHGRYRVVCPCFFAAAALLVVVPCVGEPVRQG